MTSLYKSAFRNEVLRALSWVCFLRNVIYKGILKFKIVHKYVEELTNAFSMAVTIIKCQKHSRGLKFAEYKYETFLVNSRNRVEFSIQGLHSGHFGFIIRSGKNRYGNTLWRDLENCGKYEEIVLINSWMNFPLEVIFIMIAAEDHE